MKSFKKIISIVLLVSMIFTSNAFVTLADTNSQNDVQITTVETTVEKVENKDSFEQKGSLEHTEGEQTEKEQSDSEDNFIKKEASSVEEAENENSSKEKIAEDTTMESTTEEKQEDESTKANVDNEETTETEKATSSSDETTTETHEETSQTEKETQVEETTAVEDTTSSQETTASNITSQEVSTSSEVTADTEEEKEVVATASQTEKSDEEIKNILSSIYPSYEGTLIYEDGKVKLNKDLTLESSLMFNSFENIIFDLNSHALVSPSDGPAIVIENSKFTLKDSKKDSNTVGTITGNNDFAIITAKNSTVNLSAGEITGSKGKEAVYIVDTNLNIVGATIYGGSGLNNEDDVELMKGAPAIVGNFSDNDYKIFLLGGIVIGGEGGYNKNINSSSLGGKALVINDKPEIYMDSENQIPFAEGSSGTNGGEGGDAICLSGDISRENITIGNGFVVAGGNGGSSNKSNKSNKLNKSKKVKNTDIFEAIGSIFGAAPNETENSDVEELVNKASYKTDDKFITSLKDQGIAGMCYQFAHVAMAETYMLKHYWDFCQEHLFNGEFDLSELATAYFASYNPADPLGNAPASHEEWTEPIYSWFYRGGNKYTFMNYASQYRGLHLEEDIPMPEAYPTQEDIDNIETHKYDKVVDLSDYEYWDEGWDTPREEWISRIKQKVVEDGSVVFGTSWDVENWGAKVDDTHDAMCWADAMGLLDSKWDVCAGRHAIQIIGWDDNFDCSVLPLRQLQLAYEKDPEGMVKKYERGLINYYAQFGAYDLTNEEDSREYARKKLSGIKVGNGAFLCKNSHGHYTWLSYYQDLWRSNTFTAHFTPAGKYDRVYYRDGGSSQKEETFRGVATLFNSQAKEGEKIVGASITCLNDVDVSLAISVTKYDDVNGLWGINANESMLKTIHLHKGTNTIKLNSDEYVYLEPGQQFTIRIYSSNPIYMTTSQDDLTDKNVHYRTTASGNSYIYNGYTGLDNVYALHWQKYNGDVRIRALADDIDENDVTITLKPGFKENTSYNREYLYYRQKGDTFELDPTTYEKVGHTFVGWVDQDGNEYAKDATITVNGNIELTAKYTENSYKLFYNLNGATYKEGFEPTTTRKYSETVYLPTAEDMEKPGYVFDGWWETNDFDSGYRYTKVEGGNFYSGCMSSSCEDHEYFAKWDKVSDDGKVYYKLTFKKNGGSGVMSEQYIEKDVWTPIRLNEFLAPPDDGLNTDYSFGIWNGDDNNHYQNGQNIRLTRDTEVRAMWGPRNGYDEKVTISFIAPYIESHMLEQKVVKENKNVQLNNVTLNRPGYEFAYWVEIDDKGIMYKVDNKGYVNASRDHVLYARWYKDGKLVNEPLGVSGTMPDTVIPNMDKLEESKDYVTVTFEPNGAEGSPYTQKITIKGTKLDKVKFTRDGYKFIGWEEKEVKNRTKRTWKDEEAYDAESLTLLATWMKQEDYDEMKKKILKDMIENMSFCTPIYDIITYKYIHADKKEYQKTEHIAAMERYFLHHDDNKPGYKLLGFVDQNGKKYENDTFIYADGDYEFKLLWKEIDSQEDENTDNTDPTVSTSAAGDGSEIIDPTVSTSASGSGTDDKPEDTIATEEETTAPEETKTVTITFSAGEADGEQYTQVIDKDVSTPLNPVTFTREGYTFSHWLDDLGNKIKDKDPVIYSDDMLLVAIWDEIVYTPIPINADPVYVRGGRGGNGGSGGGGGGGGGGGSALPSNNQSLQNNAAMPTALAQNNNLQQQQQPQQQQTNVHTVPPTVTNGADSTVKGQVQVNDAGVNWVFNPTDGSWSLNNKGQVLKDGFYNLTKASNNLFNNTMTQQVYCFDKNGKMVTGWVNDTKGNTYFFENTPNSAAQGTMLVGAQNIQGSVYYFDPASGQMAKNRNIGGYIFGADGKLTNAH